MAKPKSSKKSVNESTNGKEQTLPTNGAAAASPLVATAAAADSSNGETKSKARKTARKPEIVKTESRSKLIPINIEDEIRRLAYLMSERRGFEPGHETEDWLAAEHEVLQRYHHQQTA